MPTALAITRSSARLTRLLFRNKEPFKGLAALLAVSSGGGAAGPRGPGETSRAVGGAPGGAAPRPQASQTCRMWRARPEAGLANPPLTNGARGGPIARDPPTRGLANPWRLPALHSPSGERKKGHRPPRADQRTGAMAHV